MTILRKIISFIVIFILLLDSTKNISYASPDLMTTKLIKAGIFLVDLSNVFNSALKKSLEELQTENKDKIQFTIFDAKSNQSIQNEDIVKALDSDFDLFVVTPVSSNIIEINEPINKIITSKLPLIIYFPPAHSFVNLVQSYPKSVIINGDNNQAGTLEGSILANIWKANKNVFDRNNDNLMQYVMLKGPPSNDLTLSRSKYSIVGLNDAGVKTQELFSTFCSWKKDCAKDTIESEFLTLGNKIEAIISNNDNMAIGAIEALQKYGYNSGDSSKYIPVVGIGGVPEAIDLIKKGYMSGTAVQDPALHAKALYTIGLNLVSNLPPLSGTNYEFDETGVTIKIPYYAYSNNEK